LIRKLTGLVLVLALVLPGCARGTSSGRPHIAVVLKALDSEFWLAVKRGAESAAAGKADLGIVAPEREINIDQQVSMIEDQVSRGAAALVVAPAAAAQVAPALDKAAARGIPVIIMDTDIHWPKMVTYVGTDNVKGGELAGEYLAKAMPNGGEVALITGVPSDETHELRKRGFLEGIKKSPNLRLVAEQPANSERALGLTVMENILTSQPNLGGVFITNDQMALGALEAVESRHTNKPVKLVSFDAGSEVLKMISEGKVDAVVAQHPFEMGKRSVEAALAAIAKQKVEPRIDTGTELVTRDNVAAFRAE
jgi:ribose transport system substrate-binding protein